MEQNAEVTPTPGEEEFLAIALVNTRISGRRRTVDQIPDEPALARWLRRRRLSNDPATALHLAQFRALRGAARDILAALQRREAPEPAAVEQVNALAGEPVRMRLRPSGAGFELDLVPLEDSAAPAAEIARAIVGFLSSSEAQRVRTCAADDCDRMFIPTHGRQIWCSPGCGNRMRAHRHLRRQRATRHPSTTPGVSSLK